MCIRDRCYATGLLKSMQDYLKFRQVIRNILAWATDHGSCVICGYQGLVMFIEILAHNLAEDSRSTVVALADYVH